MFRKPFFAVLGGALVVIILALQFSRATSGELVARLGEKAEAAIRENGASRIKASFGEDSGWPTRHPVLSGGEGYSESTRDKVAKAVSRIDGVAGIRWADGTGFAEGGENIVRPLHCQEDVQSLLRARSIRFEESSAAIERSSYGLIDEVAIALRPCLGSIIAITGHTDTSGPEPGNISLSQERADAVRNALLSRGIPADGLRARGVGSAEPVPGLDPADPANRRIDFSVIETVSIKPTPVDTPGPN